MKKFIGFLVARIGGRLWENGGFWDVDRYEDLKVTGKLGYRMFTTGLEMAGVTPEEAQRAAEEYCKKIEA